MIKIYIHTHTHTFSPEFSKQHTVNDCGFFQCSINRSYLSILMNELLSKHSQWFLNTNHWSINNWHTNIKWNRRSRKKPIFAGKCTLINIRIWKSHRPILTRCAMEFKIPTADLSRFIECIWCVLKICIS